MKVPLARANRRQCAQLIAGLGTARVAERDVGALYRAWKYADATGKQHIVTEPRLCLRALRATAASTDDDDELHKDLTLLAAIAWRARRRVHHGGAFTAAHTTAWRAAADAVAALGAAIEALHGGPCWTRRYAQAS